MFERPPQLAPKQAEIALDSARAADHDMVRAGDPAGRDELAGKRPETPLHAVADHRSADFLGDRESDPHRGVAVAAPMDEEDEARGRDPLAAVGGEEIAALAKNA